MSSQKPIKDLLEPILSAIVETDSRLRYFACESLYNVTKVVRTQLIPGKQVKTLRWRRPRAMNPF